MAFFDRLSKGVSKAAEQTKFEAEKMLRVRNLESELSQIATEISKATAAAGEKAIELRLPGLEEFIQKIDDLKSQQAAKKAEAEAARALKFEETRPATPPPVAVPDKPFRPLSQSSAGDTARDEIPSGSQIRGAMEVQEQAGAGRFCPECGTPALPGAGFCGNCGHKLAAPEA